MGEANSGGPLPGPSAGADKYRPAGVPAEPAQPSQQEADVAPPGAAAADAASSKKKKSPYTVPAIVSAAAVIYFVLKLASGASFTVLDWVFTFGALGVGGWLILLNVAVVAGYLAFRLIGFALFMALAYAVYSPTYDSFFSPMTTHVYVYFFTLPAASPGSGCTTIPAGWVVHLFHPGGCAGFALIRLVALILGLSLVWKMFSLRSEYGLWRAERRAEMTKQRTQEAMVTGELPGSKKTVVAQEAPGSEEATVTGEPPGSKRTVVAQGTPGSEAARVKRRSKRRRRRRHSNPPRR
jgi:hypothetical protein